MAMADLAPPNPEVLALRRSMLETSALVMQRQRRLEQELLRANERLEALVRDKVALLQEVHHRVKNNLQIVSSMMNLQSRNVSPAVAQALAECQGRLRAMV